MSGDELYPTLWRTCRTLADKTRLEIVQYLVKNPEQTVSGIATHHDISVPLASICLRALNARGLIASRRKGKLVFYSVSPNPLIPWSSRLVTAMRRIFATQRKPADLLYRQATAFTHPRRIIICRALIFKGRLDYEHIVSECRISPPALSRHLKKLQKRGFLLRHDKLWSVTTPKDYFSKALIKILAEPAYRIV